MTRDGQALKIDLGTSRGVQYDVRALLNIWGLSQTSVSSPVLPWGMAIPGRDCATKATRFFLESLKCWVHAAKAQYRKGRMPGV